GVAGRPEQLLLPQRTQPVFRAGSPVALAAAYLVAGGGRAVLSLLAPAHAAELANPEDALGALAFCGPLAGRFRPFHPSGEPFGGGSLLPASGTYLRVAAGRSDRVVRRQPAQPDALDGRNAERHRPYPDHRHRPPVDQQRPFPRLQRPLANPGLRPIAVCRPETARYPHCAPAQPAHHGILGRNFLFALPLALAPHRP